MIVPPGTGKRGTSVTQVSCVFQKKGEVPYRVLQSQLTAQVLEQFLDLRGREGERKGEREEGRERGREGERNSLSRPMFSFLKVND